MKDNSEAKWVAFTEIQMPGGAQWHITLREGCTRDDIQSVISAVESAQTSFSGKDWGKPDWKKTADEKDPDPDWIKHDCPRCEKGKIRELEVKKEGPNKGKKFKGCSNKSCDFFEWI